MWINAALSIYVTAERIDVFNIYSALLL